MPGDEGADAIATSAPAEAAPRERSRWDNGLSGVYDCQGKADAVLETAS